MDYFINSMVTLQYPGSDIYITNAFVHPGFIIELKSVNFAPQEMIFLFSALGCPDVGKRKMSHLNPKLNSTNDDFNDF
jgi:hypothetical protein